MLYLVFIFHFANLISKTILHQPTFEIFKKNNETNLIPLFRQILIWRNISKVN